ncbi:MAG TPA: LemA family protein [Xanthomonadaceae bacterium]|nr:LemA family protein [Xanthomonadaceae bacterium]
MDLLLILPLLLLLAVLLWAVWVFNRLVRDRNQVRAGWADIDVQLTRRHDLVPQLVAAVQGYASHERTLLEAVTELRTQAVGLDSPARLAAVEGAMEQALSRVFALKENYPDLKASENFLKLQSELVAVEDHLQYARRFYNGAVRQYNTRIQSIPDLIVARAFSFREAEFYEAGDRAAPRVEGLG